MTSIGIHICIYHGPRVPTSEHFSPSLFYSFKWTFAEEGQGTGPCSILRSQTGPRNWLLGSQDTSYGLAFPLSARIHKLRVECSNRSPCAPKVYIMYVLGPLGSRNLMPQTLNPQTQCRNFPKSQTLRPEA